MKKYIIIVLLFVIPSLSFGINLDIPYFIEEDGIYYERDKTKHGPFGDIDYYYKVCGVAFDLYSGEIVIPSSVKYGDVECYVESVGRDAFTNTKIRRLEIPKTIKKMYPCFSGCYDLSVLIFEDSDEDLQMEASYLGEKPRSGYLYLGRNFTPIDKPLFLEFYNDGPVGGFIKKVEIGPTVKTIPRGTFSEETSIEFINCFCTIPPGYYPPDTTIPEYRRISGKYFREEVYENTILYVPEGSIESYKEHDIWGAFKNIVEGNITVDIEEVMLADINNPNIYSNGKNIIIKGNDSEEVVVYALDGRIMFRGISNCVEMPNAGLYIVRVGNHTTKVLVK